MIPRVLFYLGYDNDRGGVCSFLHALSTAAAPHFEMTLGMNDGAQFDRLALPVIEFPNINGETISPRTFLRARAIARAARDWLRADPRRVFHGCSRAGLLVALWLAHWGERRAVATVHHYGRHRWFYRHAARALTPGKRLFFLSPEMSRYYGLPPQSWDDCLPPCIAPGARASCPQNEPLKSFENTRRAGCPRSRDEVIRAAGIGALVRWKRWELVLDALAQLPAYIRAQWHFTHIGANDGTEDSIRYERELCERTRALNLETRVTWRGQQPSPTPLLRETDVLLVVSKNEPFSVARLEALDAGVPSVSAASGGAPDLIAMEPPSNGWLFRDGDAADLARVLAHLAETNALAQARIDHDSLRRFSADHSARQHAQAYAGLLES
ncbi:glycosyltransferase involved in cell wall biosynthesis [Ereboglobus sp. PH5-5]|uniref:glycosyltransferase family 4 protein n=1 Tax=Ereboglobus sp. PH5-5 TaxID=2940529 RepID=UPI0024054AFD|nr:glycosyltransferase family 4 protein [Ereboglobus sp. PH5-5]MDF9832423.1 glycosyltransferase involved in cell wall biosynthesis [Ereboglobus sp. PH5-5]